MNQFFTKRIFGRSWSLVWLGTVLTLFSTSCKKTSIEATRSSSQSAFEKTEEPNSFKLTQSTYFKIDKRPLGQLAAGTEMCILLQGDVLRYQGTLSFADNHLALTLEKPPGGSCKFSTGYLEGEQFAELAPKPEPVVPTPQTGSADTSAPSFSTGEGGTSVDQRSDSDSGGFSTAQIFPDYSPMIGKDLVAAIQKPAYCSVTGSVVACGPTARSKGCCYSCVAGPDSSYPGALSRRLPTLGRAIWPVGTAPELNTNSYARSFAEYFVPSRHESVTRMRAAYLRGKVDKVGGVGGRFKMPPGSVIVWNSCSTSAAGHIAIVTKQGQEACSDFCGNLDQCPASNIIGMFYPFW
jgi:hypothetical protein